MCLWIVESVSMGKKHSALVQEVDACAAIELYRKRFTANIPGLVFLKVWRLQFQQKDEFGNDCANITMITE